MKTNFENYLIQKGYASNSREVRLRVVSHFQKWLIEEGIQQENVHYKDLLRFVEHCRKQALKIATIKGYLGHLKSYYGFLKTQGIVDHQPVSNIRLQGDIRQKVYLALDQQELEKLYLEHPDQNEVEKRNREILGLLVFQGLATHELKHLLVEHLQFKKGRLIVPDTKRSNGRALPFHPAQGFGLYEYLMETRKEIIRRRKLDSERLFINQHKGNSLEHALTRILKYLRTNSSVRNLQELRASVIVSWLRQYNLRKVQQLAGHRYISSTEAYLPSETEGLQEEINRFHPL